MSSLKYAVLVFVIISTFSATRVQAVEQINQVVSLAEGWNIVSTPMVLESHEFSVAETSENFDIYLLDASQPTGWTTMANIGQTEFVPLFGYFINNKTGSAQTLTFNYDTDLAPNEKLFERTFVKDGWYSIGIANDEYAKDQSAGKFDIDNPSKILSLMTGKYDLVVDFTNADYVRNRRSVAVSDPWKMVVPGDVDSLNDLRETKGYAIYIKEEGVKYIGAQNNPQIGGVTGHKEELIVKTSTSDPDGTTLQVEDDSKSDFMTVFVFDLDSGESDDDINITSIPIQLTLSSSAYTEVVDDAELVINGTTYGNFTVSDTVSASPVLTFDLGGATLCSGEKMEVELRLRFKALNSINQGMTVQAEVNDPTAIVAESTGVSVIHLSGSAVGEIHTLVAVGIVVPVDGVETTTDTSGENDTLGEFTIEFEVTAVEGDFYVRDLATEGTTATTGVEFEVTGSSATTTGTLSSTADEDTSGVFTVREGETETFTLRVTVNPDASGDFRVTLTGVNYTDETDGVTVTTLYTPTPEQDFRTAYETVQGS